MSDKLRLFATTDVIYPNIKEVSADDILADSGLSTGDFVVTVPANTLTADITPLSGITYTHYVITVDDSDTPTFPTDFLDAPVPLTKDLAGWASEVWRLWVYDLATTTTTEITAPDGTSGITVAPNDTVGPDWTDGSFSIVANSGNPNSQIDYTIEAPTDAGSGLAASATYDIITDIEDSPSSTIKLAFTAEQGTITVPPGTHSWQCAARDESGNSSLSDVDSVTITGAGAGGTIGFKTIAYEVDEDVGGGELSIELERSGGTETATVTVSTVDDTASSVADFNFTEIANEEVEWVTTNNDDKTVTLTIQDQSSTYNNQCFIVIDYGSETGTETAVDVPSCRVIINSSNAAGVAGFQQETSSGDDLLVMEAENFDDSGAGTDTDNWAHVGPHYRFSPGGGNGQMISLDKNNTYGTATVLDPEAPYVEYDINYTSSTSAAHVWIRAAQRTSGVGERAHVTLLRPIATLTEAGGTATLTTTEDHDFSVGETVFIEGASVEAYNSTSGFEVATEDGAKELTFAIGGSPDAADAGVGDCFGNTSGLGLYHQGNVPLHIYTWKHQNSASANRTLDFAATGAYKLRVYSQEYDYQWDKIVLTTNGSYDPSTVGAELSGNDELEGPDESSQIPGGGAPVDNPNNTVDLPVPIPTDTTTDGVLVPIDGAVDVTPSTEITMTFANMTELVVNSHEVTTGGNPISSSLTSTDNSLRISHPAFIEGNVYTVTIDARIRDTDGDVKQVAIASPPWTFTVAVQTDPNYLIYADFEGIATSVPHVMSVANMNSEWNAAMSGTNELACVNNGNCVLVDDPAGTGRGHVFRVQAFEGEYALGQSGSQPSGFMENSHFTKADEVWMSLEVYFPAGYDFHYSTKFGGVMSDTKCTDPGLGDFSCAYVFIVINGPAPDLPQCAKDGMIQTYRGDRSGRRKKWNCVNSNPTNMDNHCTSATADYFAMQRERWYRITMQAAMNDVGVDNGILKVWIDGKLVHDKTTVRWRESGATANIGWERLQAQLFHGGDAQRFACPQTQYLYFNRWLVSDAAIEP